MLGKFLFNTVGGAAIKAVVGGIGGAIVSTGSIAVGTLASNCDVESIGSALGGAIGQHWGAILISGALTYLGVYRSPANHPLRK